MQAGISNITEFPSRLSVERFLVTFFECFLDYLPFIHVPTWQAEAAQPCLLLAMLAVGAGAYKEHRISNALYYAARFLIMTYVCHGYPILILLLTDVSSETPLRQPPSTLSG